jgi:hypothetical protein
MQIAIDVEAPAVKSVCPRNRRIARASFRATTVREWFFSANRQEPAYPIDAAAVQPVESSS